MNGLGYEIKKRMSPLVKVGENTYPNMVAALSGAVQLAQPDLGIADEMPLYYANESFKSHDRLPLICNYHASFFLQYLVIIVV